MVLSCVIMCVGCKLWYGYFFVFVCLVRKEIICLL